MQNILKERDPEMEKKTGIRFLDVVSSIKATKEVLREEFEKGTLNFPLTQDQLIEEALYQYYKEGAISLRQEACTRVAQKVNDQVREYQMLIGKEVSV